jgi:hypothetical protein
MKKALIYRESDKSFLTIEYTSYTFADGIATFYLNDAITCIAKNFFALVF